MPRKQNTRLSVEDSLIRLIDLPPVERNRVLRAFARELAAAEARTGRAEHAAYDAAHPYGTPGSVLTRPLRPRPLSRKAGLTC